jgi:hypothetical protein
MRLDVNVMEIEGLFWIVPKRRLKASSDFTVRDQRIFEKLKYVM